MFSENVALTKAGSRVTMLVAAIATAPPVVARLRANVTSVNRGRVVIRSRVMAKYTAPPLFARLSVNATWRMSGLHLPLHSRPPPPLSNPPPLAFPALIVTLSTRV